MPLPILDWGSGIVERGMEKVGQKEGCHKLRVNNQMIMTKGLRKPKPFKY